MKMNDLLIEITKKLSFWKAFNKITDMILLAMLYSICTISTLCIIEPIGNIYLGSLVMSLWIILFACDLKDVLED